MLQKACKYYPKLSLMPTGRKVEENSFAAEQFKGVIYRKKARAINLSFQKGIAVMVWTPAKLFPSSMSYKHTKNCSEWGRTTIMPAASHSSSGSNWF